MSETFKNRLSYQRRNPNCFSEWTGTEWTCTCGWVGHVDAHAFYHTYGYFQGEQGSQPSERTMV